MSNRTYRMMGLVPYNLSPIQQGIQFGHAVVEYGLENFSGAEYQQWAVNDKTFIILNGGTTNTRYVLEDAMESHIGSLNNHRQLLFDKGIQFSSFFEPDLGDQLTAVVFLVDDRVFDKKNWPDFNGEETALTYYQWMMKFDENENEVQKIIFLREFLKQFRLA
jgi:hypothetical protein